MDNIIENETILFYDNYVPFYTDKIFDCELQSCFTNDALWL